MGVQRRGGWVALGERLRRWRGLFVEVVVEVVEEGAAVVDVGWMEDSVDAGAVVVVSGEEVATVEDVVACSVGQALYAHISLPYIFGFGTRIPSKVPLVQAHLVLEVVSVESEVVIVEHDMLGGSEMVIVPDGQAV